MTKKWLYFTRHDGQVDSMPDNPKLDNSEKRKEFIGDAGASRFSVQNGCGKYPIWDGSKYISDPDMIRINSKQNLKAKRDEELNAITVKVNGKVFQSRKSDELNFRLVLSTMADGDTEEWILDDDSITEVTKAELQEAYLKGLAEGKRIFAEYKKALKEL